MTAGLAYSSNVAIKRTNSMRSWPHRSIFPTVFVNVFWKEMVMLLAEDRNNYALAVVIQRYGRKIQRFHKQLDVILQQLDCELRLLELLHLRHLRHVQRGCIVDHLPANDVQCICDLCLGGEQALWDKQKLKDTLEHSTVTREASMIHGISVPCCF